MSGVEGAFPSKAGQFSVREIKISTFNIDSLSLEFSFAKIDIQGEELKALQGMTDSISRCQPVILVDMNLTQDGIAEFMHEKDYVPYTYDSVKKRMFPGYGKHTVQHRNQFFLPARFEIAQLNLNCESS